MEHEPITADRSERTRALRRLRWGAVVFPTLFIWWSETLRHRFFDDAPTWLGNLVTASVSLAGALLFARLFFRVIERIDGHLIARNHRLATLHMLASLANQPGNEAAFLATSLPVIRAALGATAVTFSVEADASPATASRYPLTHDGQTLGTVMIAGLAVPPDPALMAAICETLAVAIVNRRLTAENARLAILDERDRIARELHDGLAQTLAAIAMHGERVRAALAEGNLAAARVAIERIERASDAAYADVREAIVGLRAGADVDFAAAVERTADWFEDTTGIAVTVSVMQIDMRALPPLVELQLLRIVQESLTNARKHAGASQVWITLATDLRRDVRLTIRDDGSGFDPDHLPRGDRQHFGLLIMRERAESLGGILTITSTPGHGTTIAVTLPSSAAERHGAA
jgi:nitrate/nitrite-specific signal transduction histidine kinase